METTSLSSMEPVILAATSAIAAQGAAWQAAIISIAVLACNIIILGILLWLVRKIDLLDSRISTVTEKEGGTANA